MIEILTPGGIKKVNKSRSTEGFFLLNAVLSLLVVSVVIIEILVFALNAGEAAVKTNTKIVESINTVNRSTVELYEYEK